jgi:hypothetical protein
MTFEDWWTEIVKTCEVPGTAAFSSLAKLVAHQAWRMGMRAGTEQTLNALNHNRTERKEENRERPGDTE